MDKDLTRRLCACGCQCNRHEEEQPYPCFDCGCQGFEEPRPAINSFHGEFRFLSNFWPVYVRGSDGLVYPSAEHAY